MERAKILEHSKEQASLFRFTVPKFRFEQKKIDFHIFKM
jgi:hypothetical protein